ncbi:DUF4142 domain-containing protein [Bradyrhizobium iriomotense]|uniref:DUF4142 domain-containing protein n=1 Tax=Bradyrhizobium iriomotense TaxID=441950 RepID=A0ABQ6AW18_9BRAD|nr:DUF4142 domain-containing protein [Bradyrhizobium iriomotense]GLR86424.1 hypothetical protein GCM10007857_31350 [Bradyrhizobium iriomotense]
MRMIVATVLLFTSTAALADNSGERTWAGHESARTPTATDVISGLYAFGRFQQGLLESADLRGNHEVKTLAISRAEDAARRDKALKQIQQAIGAELNARKTSTAGAALAGPDDSEGPAYVRRFYAAQVAEYEETIALLERYLRAPDNEALRAFAREQLPILRSQLKDAARTMADK